MKRLLLIVLVLISLESFASTAWGEGTAIDPLATPVSGQAVVEDKAAWDTGTLNLAMNQVLRITVNTGQGDDTIAVRFRRIGYTVVNCSGGVCRYSIASQFTSVPMTLAPGEGLSIDISGNSGGVRGMVLSNSANARVTAQIINTDTGEVVAVTVPKLNGDSKETG